MSWWSKSKSKKPQEEETESSASFSIPGVRKIRRLTEQVFSDNLDSGTEFDDVFFKQLGTGGAMDLPLAIIQKGQRLSLLLYRKNVRAFNAIEVIKDFTLGTGVRFKANDPKVQKVLDEHWRINEWEEKLEERIRSLSIFGEQLYPTFINEANGMVRISSVSPVQIVDIQRDPENAEDLIRARAVLGLEGPPATIFTPGSFTGEIKDFKLIKETPEGTLAGEAFYFTINKISGATRGLPDLLPSIDWLEGLDSLIFGLLERSALSQDVVFDLTYENLDENELRKKATAFMRALRNGEAFAHNERVKLDIKSPNLGASEAETVVSILLRQIQSGTRLAGLFFGDAEDLTKGSASELSMPVAKAIQGRQNTIRRMLTKIFRFQIEQSVKAGTLDGVTDFGFEIMMSKILLRDTKTVTDSLNSLATSLSTAVENRWIENDEAGKVYRSALEQLGESLDDDIDATDDLDEVEEIYNKSLGAND